MNTAVIAAARRFMTGPDDTQGEICASCGLPRAKEKKAKVLNSTFNQTEFFLFDSPFLCQKCLDIFTNADSRSKCLLWDAPGHKQIVQREAILPFLQDPPSSSFVLSVPYSFQKHHWFQAGLSQNGKLYVGTDQGCVTLDYSDPFHISYVIQMLLLMLEMGVPRKELEIGAYSTFTLSRFGKWLDEREATLAPLRASGAIRLFVTYAPARKDKDKGKVKNKLLNEEVQRVFTENEQKAIAVLTALAKASKYRQNDGLRFWQGYFKARIVRYMYEDINTFFSNVAKDTSADTPLLDVSLITDFDAETGKAVMGEIKTKTDLLLAAVLSSFKEQREAYKAEMAAQADEQTEQTKKSTKKKAEKNADTLF